MAFDARRGGRVRVGSFGTGISGLLVPAAALLARSAPSIQLEVSEIERPEAMVSLSPYELDLVVAMEAANVPAWDDARIARTQLISDPLDVALPLGQELAAAEHIALADLAHATWIAPPAGWSCDLVVHAGCAAAGCRPRVLHRSPDWGIVLAMVAGGLGVALVPRLACARAAARRRHPTTDGPGSRASHLRGLPQRQRGAPGGCSGPRRTGRGRGPRIEADRLRPDTS